MSLENEYGLNLCVIESGHSNKSSKLKKAFYAEIGKDIRFDASILDSYNYEGWKQVHYDLLIVCAAIEFADRQCARRSTQWSRIFNLTIPVTERELWNRPEVKISLCDTLRHLTGDEWCFSFIKGHGSTLACQRALPFGGKNDCTIAYSNGLDSRCVSDLFPNAIRVRVAEQKNSVKNEVQPFDRIPFSVKLLRKSSESSVRSRGFKFAAITAIAAHLSKVRDIVVPESGQGALGPVLLPLHNIYADYRNHPTFFRKMEKFINALFDYSVTYEQPRLWSTKGQTILFSLAKSGKEPETLNKTRSCWQHRWNVRFDGKLIQCGLCAACLLRRASMHAAKIPEPAEAYMFGDLSAPQCKDLYQEKASTLMVEYGSVGARHLQQLADMRNLSQVALEPHIFEISQAIHLPQVETFNNLKRLFIQHSDEWSDFIDAQGRNSFLKRWIKGGRHG